MRHPERDPLAATTGLDKRFVILIAKLGSVKNWATDQGNVDILALYNGANAKWQAANALLQQYRADLEKRGKAEVDGDTEA
eukprot:6298664-Prorocentrum_lima.AAC.1